MAAHRLESSCSPSASHVVDRNTSILPSAEQMAKQSHPAPNRTTTHDYILVSADELDSVNRKFEVTETKDSYTASHKSSLFSGTWHLVQWTDGWAAESASLALSIIALVCLICTLRYFDGSIVTEMPHDISINTLIAIIAAVIKSALLLPVAEAISQLKWIWFTTSKPLADFDKHLAALGACITLVALAIDPFTQQIIRPIQCHRTVLGNTASVPRASNLTGIGGYVGGGSPRLLDMDFAASLYVGLLSVPEQLQSKCATGVCTFLTEATSGVSYQTLGFESACVDVSAEIRSYTPNHGGSPNYYIPKFGNKSDTESGLDMLDVGFSTQARTMGFGVPYASAKEFAYFPEYWTTNDAQSSLFSFTASVNSVDEICAADLDRGSNWDTNGICRIPFATECKVWPVIQNIRASVDASVLRETVVSSQSLRFYWHTYNVVWLALPSEILSNGSWAPCHASRTYTPRTPVGIWNHTVMQPSDQYPEIPGENFWYTKERVWHVDFDSQSALVTALGKMFHDQRVGGNYGTSSRYLDGEIWIKMIYRDGAANLTTMEAYARQLARSMTVRTRMLSSQKVQNLSFARGVVVKTETCIEVRWVWIAFPVSLVLLTLTFVGVTAWRTQGTNKCKSNRVWKSSTLAVLFGGLDEDVRRMCGSLEKKSQMEVCATMVKVSLRSADDGWRLRQ